MFAAVLVAIDCRPHPVSIIVLATRHAAAHFDRTTSALAFSAHVSHIIPGPRRGYLKELIKVLITLELSLGRRCGKSAFLIALPNDKPLIRCAAQSAEISRQLIPQTFSV